MPSTLSKQEVGRRGERLAAAYLEERGWTVLGTGFLARRGEVDLVCRRADSLVLVEVKTRSGLGFGTPAEAVGARKRRALGAAAAEYRALAGWRGEIRFAVVSLLLDQTGDVRSIELLEDPF
ncbi:MAG TPA: YraN family protein [Candidatus Dormibacteraeota bacterium]